MVFIYKAFFSLKMFLFGLRITDCKSLNIEVFTFSGEGYFPMDGMGGWVLRMSF